VRAARVAAYRSERDALLATIDDPGERELALAEVRERHFTGDERQRVEILDRGSVPPP
jgi:lipase chaperone LimK